MVENFPFSTIEMKDEKAAEMSLPEKRMYQNPGSKRPLKFMSPNSQKKRKGRQGQERRDLKKLLKKMKGTDVELNEQQSVEMHKVGSIIQEHHSDELEKVFDEVSEFSDKKKTVLQQMWNLDINERKDFTADQIKNGFGCRGNRYSMITYRMALAIYIRSPAAYKSLASFNILELPESIFYKHFAQFRWVRDA
jgi:hypothetical protein